MHLYLITPFYILKVHQGDEMCKPENIVAEWFSRTSRGTTSKPAAL